MDRDPITGKFLPGHKFATGRPPKEHCLTDILSEVGSLPHDETGRTRRVQLAELVWSMALKGDLAAIRLIYNRVDGMPHQSSTVTQIPEITVLDWPEDEGNDQSGDTNDQ